MKYRHVRKNNTNPLSACTSTLSADIAIKFSQFIKLMMHRVISAILKINKLFAHNINLAGNISLSSNWTAKNLFHFCRHIYPFKII